MATSTGEAADAADTSDGSDAPEAGGDAPDDPTAESSGRNRRRAALAVLPFLVIGVGNVVLILLQGLEPLWGFLLLPPVLFCSMLAYLVFSTDFLEGRT
ncbi:hypothetical protein GRX01_13265 [Halobaculum sp. WSA2]|uniref:DUF8142 domain-containing protein n=1 Tax=Halobaculum saliterrae TaxID=2073113 RepID=A0A6B0T0Z1_9EURY|nr:hypothetical protein [Halobaculum saliterrae]MXR42302.1 hypothetical protein [Halobaculum saliterrae]